QRPGGPAGDAANPPRPGNPARHGNHPRPDDRARHRPVERRPGPGAGAAAAAAATPANDSTAAQSGDPAIATAAATAAPRTAVRRKRAARPARDEAKPAAARVRKPRPEAPAEPSSPLDVDADALGGLDLHLDPDLTEEDEDLEILVEEPTGPRTPAGEAALRIGIRRLRPEQERGIAAALDGNDVLMVLPTGFGKSACYQIPSMMLPKPVVLVSPLLALIKDQHEKLLRFGIPCVRLDGTIRGKAREAAFARIRAGGSLLVMTTPEKLGTQDTHTALKHSGISLAAIDEAHCISEWGHNFRPEYLRLAGVAEDLGLRPVLALTATA
ncbi:MAG: DEAD/DEAH box helicase, partial [Alphaproteobacteria bacterium]